MFGKLSQGWVTFDAGRDMACARYEREGAERRKEPWNKKTRLCRRFTDFGTCSYGDACTFAHGPEELRVFADWDPDQWSAQEKVLIVKTVRPFR